MGELMADIKLNKSRRQRGMGLIELMIAISVLAVGVLGSMIPILLAIGSNGRSRSQSNSTVIAQMVMEKIMSVPASTSPVLAITDCSGVAQNINTAGAPGAGAGAALAGGMADYTQAPGTAGDPPGYFVLYSTAGANCATGGRGNTYDVRWNIQTLSPYSKLITVSAKIQGNAQDPKLIAFPVTIRSIAGQGT
jgi:prepilin-type N-terminal cleavage/methylation domain-containing protein